MNGQNVVGIKDKEISRIIEEGGQIVTITIIPSFIYTHIMKRYSIQAFSSLNNYNDLSTRFYSNE